jgi:hypothetical protein
MDKNLEKLKKEIGDTIRGIPKKSKHVLWNHAPSEENFDSDQNPFTRFYFAIIDKRVAYRETTRSKLREMLSEQNSGVAQIGRDVNFKVKESEWGLLFVVYDALRNLQDLNFRNRGITAKIDYNFREKDVIEIEDYLNTQYK